MAVPSVTEAEGASVMDAAAPEEPCAAAGLTPVGATASATTSPAKPAANSPATSQVSLLPPIIPSRPSGSRRWLCGLRGATRAGRW